MMPAPRISNMEIGKKIREIRILNGLTQEELADRSELSKGFKIGRAHV